MATDREQPDDLEDAELASVLQTNFSAPEPRAEFVRALADRLDAQFALGRAGTNERPSLVASLQSPNGAANGKLGAMNGKHTAVPRPELNGHADSAPAAAADRADVIPMAPRRWRRWSMLVAAAASLFVATIVFGPAYGWTAAIRAWVVGIVQLTGRETSVGTDPIQVTSQSSEIAAAEPATNLPAVAPTTTDAVEPPVVDLPGGTAPRNATNVTAEEVIVVDLRNNVQDEEESKAADKPVAEAAPPEVKAEAPPWAPFDEPLPLDELRERVDNELAALWQARGIRPVGPATDGEFMRRVYLDLTGRIPSVNEVYEYRNDPSPNKREQLVERLLASRDHATHLAAVWRGILLPEVIDLSRLGGSIKFEEWLSEQFVANKSYDKIVRDLLLVEGRVAESGPLLFYAAARLLPEELAGKTSRAFLGVRMECAQCHDHPFDEVTQKDFWRFAAFFSQISRPKGRMDVTSPVLQVRDTTQGDVMIPESEEVVPPRLPLSAVDVASEPDGPSRRQHLADWLTSKNNGQFARATVNRVWEQLFGRGLVDPVDDMRPANPPLAPEVLETLSRDFAASNFDLRRLFRALVLTQAYQLASSAEDNDPARALHFAQMNIKSITAEQLYDCITVATRRSTPAPAPTTAIPLAVGVDRFQDVNRQAFIQQFRAPAGKLTDYHAGIPQALTLMHGGLIHSSTDLATSGLLKSLSAPFFTDGHRVETLFLSTLSRLPAPAERELIERQLNSAKTDQERQQVLGDVLWALLNSGEFTFNH
jgi:hypothetical protein